MKLKKQKRSRKHVKKTYKRRKTYKKRGGGTGAGTSGAGVAQTIWDAIFKEHINVNEIRTILDNDPDAINVLNNYPAKKFNFTGPDVLVDMTPLYYVVSRLMIHKPVSQQFINDTNTKDEYYKIAELLIDRGADVNFATTEWFPGWRPIHWAAEYCQLDMVNLLKSRGANINATYEVPSPPFSSSVMSLRGVASMRLNDFDDIINKREALNYITQSWTGTAQRFPV